LVEITVREKCKLMKSGEINITAVLGNKAYPPSFNYKGQQLGTSFCVLICLQNAYIAAFFREKCLTKPRHTVL